MFLGHQHLLLPGADFAGIEGVDIGSGALYGVAAFMPGFWGSHLGVIDLELERRDAAMARSPPRESRRGRSIGATSERSRR